MKESLEVSANRETPAFFPAGDNVLFGILTQPVSPNGNRAVVVLSGGGSPTSLSRNRLSTRMCRLLSADGYMAMRFDYHGVGESSGEVGQFHLATPFSDDLVAVTEWLKTNDAHDFVLLGSCFGARSALAGSPFIPELAAVVLICPPVRDFAMGERTSTRLARELRLTDYVKRALHPRVLRKLFDRESRKTYKRIARAKFQTISSRVMGKDSFRRRDTPADSWLSDTFVRRLSDLAERDVPVLFLYGRGDEFFEEFEEARSGRLGAVIDKGRHLIDIQTIEGRLHGFLSLDVQDKVLQIIGDWLRQRVA